MYVKYVHTIISMENHFRLRPHDSNIIFLGKKTRQIIMVEHYFYYD